MISLQLPAQHVSSYATSINHPSVQSSFDYTASVCNPQSWASVAPYPSPPMSSSPTATAQYANHAQRGFDPNYTRIRSQPTMTPELHFWPQQNVYHQSIYSEHAPQPTQQMTTLPLHHPRSPRVQQGLAAPYLPPLPTHVSQPYPTFAQSQQARDFVPPPTTYQVGMPAVSLAASAGKTINKPVRRTKQHVQTACFNCKKAHLSCDVGRPCQRCKQSGKQDTCYNVAHKRRGRPRLRDTFGNKIVRSNESQMTNVNVPSTTGAVMPAQRRCSDPNLRVLKSQNDMRPTAIGVAHPTTDGLMGSSTDMNLAFTRPISSTSPIAFLDLDLKVVRTNAFFNSLFGLDTDHRGPIFDSFIDTSDLTRLQEVRGKLREEKNARDPTYLAPLRMNGTRDADSIPMVESVALPDLVNQGFQEMNVNLRLRLAGGGNNIVRINIRLAKAEVFFAVLILPPVSEILPPYPQQQNRPLPSPSSNYAYGNGYYGGPDVSGLVSRGSVSTSAPASPYYTFAPSSMQSANPSRMSSAQTSYDPGMYFSQTVHTTPIYNYTTQSGVPSQAMTGAAEPRQFQGYPHDPPQMQLFSTPGHQQQQQLHQPAYQLPPIGAQGERVRSTGHIASSMSHVPADNYGRDPQQAYMQMRDDGQSHIDGSNPMHGLADKARGPHLTHILQ